jgi:hypothetical protein
MNGSRARRSHTAQCAFIGVVEWRTRLNQQPHNVNVVCNLKRTFAIDVPQSEIGPVGQQHAHQVVASLCRNVASRLSSNTNIVDTRTGIQQHFSDLGAPEVSCEHERRGVAKMWRTFIGVNLTTRKQ